jgi:hypothetical protein
MEITFHFQKNIFWEQIYHIVSTSFEPSKFIYYIVVSTSSLTIDLRIISLTIWNPKETLNVPRIATELMWRVKSKVWYKKEVTIFHDSCSTYVTKHGTLNDLFWNLWNLNYDGTRYMVWSTMEIPITFTGKERGYICGHGTYAISQYLNLILWRNN